MPWRELLVSEARMQFIVACKGARESFASICRRFGISRKNGYKWWKRYRDGGVRALVEVSRRPRRPGRKYPACWRERLRKARRKYPHYGAKKLRWVLRKTVFKPKRIPAVSTLGRWLLELDLSKKPKRRVRRGPVLPWRGVQAPKGPNDVWTVDFKGWFRTGDGKRCQPLTVRDLFSRYVLAVVLLPNQSDAAVRRAMVRIFRRYGLPKTIRVDNGAPFGGTGALGLSRLSVWWLRLGIAVEFGRRAHPQDNAAHEQMHRVFKAEVATPPAPSVAAQNRRDRNWIARYNHYRPHQALGEQVPARIYRRSLRRMAEQMPPAKYPCTWNTRRVRSHGYIKWIGRQRFIGRGFVKEIVGLKTVASGIHEVYLQQHLIGVLYDRDLTGMRPTSIAQHPETCAPVPPS